MKSKSTTKTKDALQRIVNHARVLATYEADVANLTRQRRLVADLRRDYGLTDKRARDEAARLERLLASSDQFEAIASELWELLKLRTDLASRCPLVGTSGLWRDRVMNWDTMRAELRMIEAEATKAIRGDRLPLTAKAAKLTADQRDAKIRAYIHERLKRGDAQASISRESIAKATGISGGMVSASKVWKAHAANKRQAAVKDRPAPTTTGDDIDDAIERGDWKNFERQQADEQRRPTRHA